MAGNVRKRGKKWYYSFETAGIKGKRKRIERVGGTTKKEAQAALRTALSEYENSGLHFEVKTISVADYLDYWLEQYVKINCKYNTQLGYISHVENHIKPALGSYQLKSITPAILQSFINAKYKEGMNNHHLVNMMSVLSGAFKYAVHPLKYIKDNPMQYVKKPNYEYSRLYNEKKKIITQDDFNRIIKRFPLGSSFYITFMIGLHTGCRIGEISALTWDDIDLEKSELTINKNLYFREKNWYFGSTKTKSSNRTIKIGATLLLALKQHKKLQNENKLKYGTHYINQYETMELIDNQPLRRIHSLDIPVGKEYKMVSMICTKENGEKITTDSIKYAVRVIKQELEIDFNFHSLRHTHATMLIENGAKIKDVQTRLGHSKIATTLDIYTKSTERMQNESVDIFEKAIKKDLPTG